MYFYPRDATRKRGTCYGNVAWWLAGWLDVKRRYFINTAKPVFKLFQPSGSPIILVSYDPCANTQFQGKPLQWGVKYTEGGENWRFSTEISVYLGNGKR